MCIALPLAQAPVVQSVAVPPSQRRGHTSLLCFAPHCPLVGACGSRCLACPTSRSPFLPWFPRNHQCPDDGGVGVSLRRAFERYDKDRSGLIDRKEFEGLLFDLGSKPAAWKVDEAFATVDTDHSGTISYDEFARCGGRVDAGLSVGEGHAWA